MKRLLPVDCEIPLQSLTPTGHEGHHVLCTGHWSGDFNGIVRYAGYSLAIITDTNGKDREICYLKTVEFYDRGK